MKKNSFILYTDAYDCIESYADAELGKLMRAIFIYETKNEITNLPENLKIAFNFIKKDLDRNRQHYEEVCEKNRKNALARWGKKKKKAKATNRKQSDEKMRSHANYADNDNDNENEIYIQENKTTEKNKTKLVLLEFQKHYQLSYGISYVVNWKKDMALAKKLLDTQEISVIKEKIKIFFTTEMNWVKGNRDFGLFISQYNKLELKKKTSKTGVKYL